MKPNARNLVSVYKSRGTNATKFHSILNNKSQAFYMTRTIIHAAISGGYDEKTH